MAASMVLLHARVYRRPLDRHARWVWAELRPFFWPMWTLYGVLGIFTYTNLIDLAYITVSELAMATGWLIFRAVDVDERWRQRASRIKNALSTRKSS